MQFEKRWNYPGCLGAVDGKHIRITCPKKSGSLFYNYKHYFLLVLMAVANANYELLYVNVGAAGKTADGGCWQNCDFQKAVAADRLNIPPGVHLQGGKNISCHFVGDDAFALNTRMLKPFPHKFLSEREKIFNYRLSRSRRVVENVFGIMASKFQVLRGEIRLNVEHTTNVVHAICVLHNLLRQHCGGSYMPPGSYDVEDLNHNIVPGDWRNMENLPGVRPTSHKNPTTVAKKMRSDLADFFMSPAGEVPWQYNSIRSAADDILDSLS